LSIAEDEYVTVTTETCQEVLMSRMLMDLCHNQEEMTTIFCNNTSAIALSKNYVFHKRTKHIDAKHHCWHYDTYVVLDGNPLISDDKL